MNSANSMHRAGHPKLVLWVKAEGQDGEGVGRGVLETLPSRLKWTKEIWQLNTSFWIPFWTGDKGKI